MANGKSNEHNTIFSNVSNIVIRFYFRFVLMKSKKKVSTSCGDFNRQNSTRET